MVNILVYWTIVAATCSAEIRVAALTGYVLDTSDAAIAGVTVQVRSTSGGETLRVTTDAQGRYSLAGLPPGRYSIQAQVAGFKLFTREDVMLCEGETLEIPIVLEIQGPAESMTVTAKAPRLEAQPETRTRNFEEILEIREASESGAKDVGEALSELEGMWKIRKAAIANDVVLRGFQQDNLNVIIDGVRIYGACPSNMDPAAFHVDFAEVEQAEVVKGPFSVKDQGTLGGVIRLKNAAPAEGLQVTPRMAMRSFSYLNPSMTASFANNRFSVSSGFSYRTSDPYIDGSGKPFTSYANYEESARSLNAFDVGTAWLKFSPNFGNNHLQLSYTGQHGGRILYPGLQMDAIYNNTDRLDASFESGQYSGLVRRVRLDAYFSDVRHWMTDELRHMSMGMASLAATKVMGTRAEADMAGFTAGVEVYKRNWDTTSVPNVNVWVSGLYGEYHTMLGSRLHLQVGGRLDHATDEARSVGSAIDLYWAYHNTRSVTMTDAIPSGNVWLAYTMPKGMELFLGVGSSVRLPDPQERYFLRKQMGSDWVGNPALDPTRNTEVDLGINYRGHRFYLRPTLYYSHLADYITVNNQSVVNMVPGMMNSQARSYENVQAKMYGGEMSYSIGISDALLLMGGISYTRGIKEIYPVANILDRDLAEMPPLKARMALRYGTRRLFGEIEGLAVHAQDKIDSDLKEQPTAGYGLLNLKAGYHFEKWRLTGGIDNLLDRFYYEPFSYQRDPFRSGVRIPEPGRTFYLIVSYQFWKWFYLPRRVGIVNSVRNQSYLSIRVYLENSSLVTTMAQATNSILANCLHLWIDCGGNSNLLLSCSMADPAQQRTECLHRLARPQILLVLAVSILLISTATGFSIGSSAGWVPARWDGGPLEVARRAKDKVMVEDAPVREAIAKWYNPSTLGLLEGTPINCLLVTFDAAAGSTARTDQYRIVKDYAQKARERGIAVLGLVYSGTDPQAVAVAADEAGLDGLVLEGEIAVGDEFAGKLEASLRSRNSNAVVIPIARDAASVRTAKAPLLAVEGVRPDARDLADMGIRAGPSAEPWIDSNIWLVRSFRLGQAWRPIWISQQPNSNSPGDYVRCVADSAVAGGRWIVTLDDDFRVRLFREDAGALATWRSIGCYLKFAEDHADWRSFEPYGNLGIVLDTAGRNPAHSSEYLNLVARRQVPYRVIERSQLSQKSLGSFQAILAADLAPPRGPERKMLQAFAEQGGLVISGPSWGDPPKENIYAEVPLGKGRVVVYKDDPPDPETLARDLLDLMEPEVMGLSAFNVPSVLTYASTSDSGKRALIQMLNYAMSPFTSKITLRFNGRFKTARLYTPENTPLELEAQALANGRTEVAIPKLAVWGALLLE